MSTAVKTISAILIFMLLCVIRMVFTTNSAIWDSLYFIIEHSFDIVLLLILSKYLYESIQLAILYCFILYKSELIIYNIFLAFSDNFSALSTSYDAGMWITFSIWLLLLLCLIAKRFLK